MMAEPATGTAAAVAAIGATSGAMFTLGALMPPGASLGEFVWGCIFGIAGAFSYQFIKAQAQRQSAADKNIPIEQRPRIDLYMLGYSMCGAPMASACLIFAIHQLNGAAGFGDATWLQSAAGFMVAGAAGPEIVSKVVGTFITFVSSRTGGGKT